VIVVIGIPTWRASDPPGPDGRACRIAVAAAARGAAVELVGRAGDDGAGDQLMLALAKAGVGHVALLRDPVRATPVVASAPDDDSVVPGGDRELDVLTGSADAPILEPADVALALGYLPSYDVIIVADDVPAEVVPIAGEAAEFGGAHLVVLVGEGNAAPHGVPARAAVFAAPRDDSGGAFDVFVGMYAAAIDAGDTPAEAFARARGSGWERPVD
jgi:sugar/nucleoside kinase (ribokinase family)